MVIETELKARLIDPEKIKSALSALGSCRYGYHKKDTYWIASAGPMGAGFEDRGSPSENPHIRLRVRNEEKKYTDGQSQCNTLVTFKTRTLCDGIETNTEHEMAVSDSGVFEEILRQLGCKPDISKEKQGWAWIFESENHAAPLLAELSHVKHLGWFIELEILSDTRDEQILEQNRSRLRALLGKLGIENAAIESRPYSELLRQVSEHPGI
jgi:adenylate cyclase class 2